VDNPPPRRDRLATFAGCLAAHVVDRIVGLASGFRVRPPEAGAERSTLTVVPPVAACVTPCRYAPATPVGEVARTLHFLRQADVIDTYRCRAGGAVGGGESDAIPRDRSAARRPLAVACLPGALPVLCDHHHRAAPAAGSSDWRSRGLRASTCHRCARQCAVGRGGSPCRSSSSARRPANRCRVGPRGGLTAKY
jgi:hypothetical protein